MEIQNAIRQIAGNTNTEPIEWESSAWIEIAKKEETRKQKKEAVISDE